MENVIAFQISVAEKVVIYLPCSVNEIYRYDEIKIVFSSDDKEYVLYNNDFIIEAITAFNNLLIKIVNNEAEICESLLEKGIGYFLNEYYQDKLELNMIKGKEGENWIGDKFSLWESKEYHTWLYNKENEIYIEVTPIYKWHFDEPEEQNEFETYDTFAENYKACIVRSIKKEIAVQWLETCKRLLNIIAENDKLNEMETI